jgi:hypothetical protein
MDRDVTSAPRRDAISAGFSVSAGLRPAAPSRTAARRWPDPFGARSRTVRALAWLAWLTATGAWVVRLGIVSEGFATVEPAGWLILAAVALVMYGAVHLVLALVSGVRAARLALGASILWWLGAPAWLFVTGTGSLYFGDRLAVLMIVPAALAWLGLAFWRWYRA